MISTSYSSTILKVLPGILSLDHLIVVSRRKGKNKVYAELFSVETHLAIHKFRLKIRFEFLAYYKCLRNHFLL